VGLRVNIGAPRPGRSVMDLYRGGRLVRRTVHKSVVVKGRVGTRVDDYRLSPKLHGAYGKLFRRALDEPALKAKPGYRFYSHRASGLLSDGYRTQPVLFHGAQRRPPLEAIRRTLRRDTPSGPDKRYFRRM
jgi:hypothetical protein